MKTKNVFAAIVSVLFVAPLFAQLIIHDAIELEIQTEEGKYYQIQTSLDQVSWVNYGNEFSGTGSSVFTLISTREKENAYFRVLSSDTSTQVTIDVPSYANLSGRWNYRFIQPNSVTPWSVKILGTGTENGMPVYVQQEYDQNGFPNDQEYWHTDLSEGLFEIGGLNDYGKPTEMKFFWEPIVSALMKTFVPGAEYINNYTRTDFPGIIIEGRIKTESDTVTVPLGTFDCLKVTRTFKLEEQELVFTSWYAKNVGMIKRIQENGDIWELVSYQP